MRTFHLNKLVRDKLIQYMLEQGQKPEYRTLTPEETLHQLKRKVVEEIGEVSLENAVDELADVQEALDAILKLSGQSKAELRAAQTKKRRKFGAFKKGIYISKVAVPRDSEWSDYYAREPQRFPEE